MSRPRVAVVCLLVLCCTVGQAHALRGGPTLQLQWDQQRDDRFNRTRYAGPGFMLGGELLADAAELQHVGMLALGLSYLDNRFDHGLLRLRYTFGYMLRMPLSRVASLPVQLVLGATGDSRFGLYVPEDPEHLHWTTHYALRVGARVPRGAWSWQVSLPLLGLVSRSPHHTVRNNDKPGVFDILGRIHDPIRTCTVDTCFGTRAQADYRVGASVVGLAVDYLHVSWPAPVHMLELQLRYSYLFGA